MEIKNKKLIELNPNIHNSRTHNESQINQLVASIEEFGFTNPIIIDENNSVLAGHGRLSAALIIGLEEVPTITLHDLSDTQKRAYIITDNKLGLNAEWDDELLQKELRELFEKDFNLSSLGWNKNELTSFVGNPLDNLAEDKDFLGSSEIEFSDIDNFTNQCPKCGFEF